MAEPKIVTNENHCIVSSFLGATASRCYNDNGEEISHTNLGCTSPNGFHFPENTSWMPGLEEDLVVEGGVIPMGTKFVKDDEGLASLFLLKDENKLHSDYFDGSDEFTLVVPEGTALLLTYDNKNEGNAVPKVFWLQSPVDTTYKTVGLDYDYTLRAGSSAFLSNLKLQFAQIRGEHEAMVEIPGYSYCSDSVKVNCADQSEVALFGPYALCCEISSLGQDVSPKIFLKLGLNFTVDDEGHVLFEQSDYMKPEKQCTTEIN